MESDKNTIKITNDSCEGPEMTRFKRMSSTLFLFYQSRLQTILQGWIQDVLKGVHMYKGVGVHFTDFISFFLNIP